MEVAHNASYITTMLLFFSIAMPIVVPYSHAYYSSSFDNISLSVAPDIVIPDDFRLFSRELIMQILRILFLLGLVSTERVLQ